jgi:hypothetical protein
MVCIGSSRPYLLVGVIVLWMLDSSLHLRSSNRYLCKGKGNLGIVG